MEKLTQNQVKDLAKNSTSHKAVLWLNACFIYYLRPDEESCFSDYEFDDLTKDLLENYEELTVGRKFPDGSSNPPLSNIITKDRLLAGSGFSIKEEEYPSPIRHGYKFFTR